MKEIGSTTNWQIAYSDGIADSGTPISELALEGQRLELIESERTNGKKLSLDESTVKNMPTKHVSLATARKLGPSSWEKDRHGARDEKGSKAIRGTIKIIPTSADVLVIKPVQATIITKPRVPAMPVW